MGDAWGVGSAKDRQGGALPRDHDPRAVVLLAIDRAIVAASSPASCNNSSQRPDNRRNPALFLDLIQAWRLIAPAIAPVSFSVNLRTARQRVTIGAQTNQCG